MCVRYYLIIKWKHLGNVKICLELRKRWKNLRGKNKKEIIGFR